MGQQMKPGRLDLRCIERGRHHVIVKQASQTEDRRLRIPMLYFIVSDTEGNVRPEAFDLLIEYYEDRLAMSYAWKKNGARAIGLLVDYSMAMSATTTFRKWKENGVLERRLYRGLAKALLKGTEKIDGNGRVVDPTRLYWRGLGRRQAHVLLSSLTLFFQWMREDDANSKWISAASVDHLAEHPLVVLKIAAELQMRRSASLLGHMKGMKSRSAHPYPFIVRPQPVDSKSVPTFPVKHYSRFLCQGFENRNGWRNETAELAAHLIFGLGIRESESFHLFVTDVQFVAGVPWIFFHHPQEGKVRCGSAGLITRQEYLQRFGMLPRNIDEGRNKAGWKGMAGDAEGTPGFWLPIDPLRNRAARLLHNYIFKTRPAIMAARPRSLSDHPFLLVSPRRGEGPYWGDVGDPYTLEALEGAWERAVIRIGRRFNDHIMAKMCKPHGNTLHGGRHFYGRFLLNAGVEGAIIRDCMHHRSLNAYLAYTRLTSSEINDILQETQERPSERKPSKNLRDQFMSQFQQTPSAAY